MNNTDLATGLEVFNVHDLLPEEKQRTQKNIPIKIYYDSYGQEDGQLTKGLCLEASKVWSALDSRPPWISVPFVPLIQ